MPDDLTKPSQISGIGLATDYLNHFNEAVMASELVSEFPEFLEELLLWQKRTYREHFEINGSNDALLVLEAYELLPLVVRSQFDKLTNEVNLYFETSIAYFIGSQGQGIDEEMKSRIEIMRAMVARLDGFIHGTSVYEPNGHQSIIDQMF